MKYEYQVRMQLRHLKVVVGALKFRQRLFSGDVYGTLGRAAMEAGEKLPEIAREFDGGLEMLVNQVKSEREGRCDEGK